MKDELVKIIKEEIQKYIEEDYPSSFNMEKFKSITSFNGRIKYATEHLQRLSSGSSRIVFKIDEEKALKLAKNKKGLAQNEVEHNYSTDHYINPLFADVYDVHPQYQWIEMELAKKLTTSRFQQLTGHNFKDFANAILYFDKSRQSGLNPYEKPEKYDEYWEDEFIYDVFQYVGNYDVPSGDIARISSWGDFGDEVKLIDYGLDNNVSNEYYS